MEAVELRPLGVGEILDVAIKIWRTHFVALVKATVLVVAPVQVLTALVQASLRPVARTPGFEGTVAPRIDDLWTYFAGIFVVGVLGFIAAELATAASFKAVSEAYLGQVPDWRASLRFALSRLGPLLWLALVTNFLMGLGLLALVIPGVYFWGAWRVATPALLIEDVRGRKARRRSRELVQGRWWPVALTVILALILNSIVSVALRVPAFALTFAHHHDDLASILVQAVVGTIAGAVTTPFIAAVVTVLYFDLRVRREGFDLELLAARIGTAPEGIRAVAPLAPPPPLPGSQPPFWPPPPGWQPRPPE